MTNLNKIAPTVAAGIPHSRAIIGFRNILAHGYAELDHNKVRHRRDLCARAPGRGAEGAEGLSCARPTERRLTSTPAASAAQLRPTPRPKTSIDVHSLT
jgi:hypothetical protein